MFVLKKDLTLDLIRKYIEIYKAQQLPRLQKLKRYYQNKNDKIRNRVFEDESKPNNKIAHPLAAYITDTLSAYMVGKPIAYSCDDEILNDEIHEILSGSDDVDLQIAEKQSIFGDAFELMYINESGEIRFTALDALGSIPIYDGSVENNLKYFIYYTEDQDPITYETIVTVYVYDIDGCSKYVGNSIGDIALVECTENPFGKIQINEYKNNNYLEGDFEKVIPLIDSYDTMSSDSLNELDYFSDAYLLFSNCEIDTDKIQDMKNKKVIEVTSGDNGQAASVQWLVKNANDSEIENMKKRTVDDIHKLSKVPNLDPSAFVSHTTASHVFYSLLATEDLVSKKEKKFKIGLQQRLEKIVNILNLKGIDTHYNYKDINIIFTRNVPQALETIADPISKLRGLLSDETLVGMISSVTNPNKEIAKRDEELKKKNDALDSYGIGDANEI